MKMEKKILILKRLVVLIRLGLKLETLLETLLVSVEEYGELNVHEEAMHPFSQLPHLPPICLTASVRCPPLMVQGGICSPKMQQLEMHGMEMGPKGMLGLVVRLGNETELMLEWEQRMMERMGMLRHEDYPESQGKGQQKKSKLKKVKKTWIYVATQQLSRPECRYVMCVLSTVANATCRGHLCELVNLLSSPSPPPHSSTPANDLTTIAHSIKATTMGSHIMEFWRMVGYMQFALVVDWYALLHSFCSNTNDISFKGVLL